MQLQLSTKQFSKRLHSISRTVDQSFDGLMELLSVEKMHAQDFGHINRRLSLYLVHSPRNPNQSFHGNFLRTPDSQITDFCMRYCTAHTPCVWYGSGSSSAIPGRSVRSKHRCRRRSCHRSCKYPSCCFDRAGLISIQFLFVRPSFLVIDV